MHADPWAMYARNLRLPGFLTPRRPARKERVSFKAAYFHAGNASEVVTLDPKRLMMLERLIIIDDDNDHHHHHHRSSDQKRLMIDARQIPPSPRSSLVLL